MVGNIPNFNEYDVLRAFLLVGEPISRQELASELGVGEGTVRTILDILKKNKLIFSTRQGHSLTKKGNALLKTVKRFVEINKKVDIGYYKNFKKAAVLLKGVDSEVNVGLRDKAIKNGAEAALIFVYKNGLVLPYAEEFKEDFKELENLFSFKNGDILIVTFAGSSREAENSALSLFLFLTPKLNKIFINSVS